MRTPQTTSLVFRGSPGRAVRGMASALFLVIAAACASDATAPEETVSEERYVLQSVDGSPLPFAVSLPPGPVSVEVTAGSVRVISTGTCSVSDTARIDNQGTVTTEVDIQSCTWTASGSAISLTFSDHAFTGTVVGTTLTLIQGDESWVYVGD